METYGLELIQTCDCCPEQYSVYKDGTEVGYLRLRHGFFRAEYPTVFGETVYTAEPEGDGMFEDHEREIYLHNALKAIHERLRES